MHKIAFGKNYQNLEIDPEKPADEIVKTFAKYADIKNESVVVCILDRDRHKQLINLVRSTGARIKLIPDGDVSAVIATSVDNSGIDIYMGIGGSPEGVLAAAALRCLGGKIYTKLIFENNEVFYWFWAIFDIKFGLLAKKYVGYTSPDPKKCLGINFPECMFFSQTPVF